MKLILKLNHRNVSAHRFKELDAALNRYYNDIVSRVWAGQIQLKPEAPEYRVKELKNMLGSDFSDIIWEVREALE